MFELLVHKVGQHTSWQSECAACVQDVHIRHCWLAGVLDGCLICAILCAFRAEVVHLMFWYILERCTSTNCTRSVCIREAHVSQWVDHSHSNVEPCWAGDESARRRVRGATCQFLLTLFNLDQAPRLHRAPQESSLPTTL